ncbi:MAG: hypothetical protein R3E31_24095 [Chloroflexota bacterium]
MLAAYTMGIRNLFVVMGDPTRIGDFPEAMDSYDIVPTGLIHLIDEISTQVLINRVDPLIAPTNFVVGCALNLTRRRSGTRDEAAAEEDAQWR